MNQDEYLQIRFGKKHQHKYHVDSEDPTKPPVCLCGKEKYSPKAKAHKYNAKGTTYNGYHYDSGFEANYAMQLDWRLKATDSNRIKAWDRQFPVHIIYHRNTLLTTKVDFRIHHMDGSFELVECKGFITPDYPLKKKLITMMWIPDHPNYRYTVVR